MKVLDKINFQTKLELAIAKAQREKFPFSLIAVSPKKTELEKKKLLESIIEAQIRKSDIVGTTDNDVYIILLKSTVKSEAQLYLDRLVKSAVVDDGISIRTSIEQYKEGDDEMDIMLRLYMKLH